MGCLGQTRRQRLLLLDGVVIREQEIEISFNHPAHDRATLLGISKRGNAQLRSLLVQGARAVMRYIERRHDALGTWVQSLLRRRHSNVVACALANKMARIVWAILARGGEYRAQPSPA